MTQPRANRPQDVYLHAESVSRAGVDTCGAVKKGNNMMGDVDE